MKKGLVHIYTGEGKGKTTAALGLAVRAAGSGLRVLFVQFFKEEAAESGEKDFLRALEGHNIELVRSNCRHPMFTGARTDEAAVREDVARVFEAAREKALSGKVDMVVLDEAVSAINGGWLDLGGVLEFLDTRPADVEVALTGRSAPVELVKMADYVTEMLKIKHPFDQGVAARKGIEY